MPWTKVDRRGRVVLPQANPEEVYDVLEQSEGCYLLVRRELHETRIPTSRKDCLRALEDRPLRLGMTWEELQRLTREP